MSEASEGGLRCGITQKTLAIVDATLVIVSERGSIYKPQLVSIEFVFLDGGASGFALEETVSKSKRGQEKAVR